MVNTSRRMPPTPVAAPWYGSTADGWLCDSILKATAQPVGQAQHPGVLARALDHLRAGGGEALEDRLRVLVGAVLRPERREHAELGERRRAAEQLEDAAVLEVVQVVLPHDLGRDRTLAGERGGLGGACGGGAGHRWSQSRTRLRLLSASEITRVSRRGPVLVRHGVDLAGVEPHPAAVGAGLDLDAVVGAAGEVVPVLRALHVVRLPLRLDARRLRPCARCFRRSSASCLTKYSSSLRLGLSVVIGWAR